MKTGPGPLDPRNETRISSPPPSPTHLGKSSGKSRCCTSNLENLCIIGGYLSLGQPEKFDRLILMNNHGSMDRTPDTLAHLRELVDYHQSESLLISGSIITKSSPTAFKGPLGNKYSTTMQYAQLLARSASWRLALSSQTKQVRSEPSWVFSPFPDPFTANQIIPLREGAQPLTIAATDCSDDSGRDVLALGVGNPAVPFDSFSIPPTGSLLNISDTLEQLDSSIISAVSGSLRIRISDSRFELWSPSGDRSNPSFAPASTEVELDCESWM